MHSHTCVNAHTYFPNGHLSLFSLPSNTCPKASVYIASTTTTIIWGGGELSSGLGKSPLGQSSRGREQQTRNISFHPGCSYCQLLLTTASYAVMTVFMYIDRGLYPNTLLSKVGSFLPASEPSLHLKQCFFQRHLNWNKTPSSGRRLQTLLGGVVWPRMIYP